MTILNDITVQIDSAIDAMTTGTGYNFNYDNVNEYRPDNKTYPAVKTIYQDNDYLDPDEQMVDSYTLDLTAIFEVTVDDTIANTRLYLSQVLEDFQRLLEADHANLQAEGMIVADLISDEPQYFQVRARPGKLIMEWQIKYRVKRSDPSTTT